MADKTLEERISAIEKWIEKHDKEEREELEMKINMAKISASILRILPNRFLNGGD